MDDIRAHTRIHVKSGTDFYVVETADEVRAQMTQHLDPTKSWADRFVEVVCVHAQRLLGEEHAYIRADEIVSVQELTEAGWAWQVEATERWYTRQMQEQLPNEKIAEAQQKLVEILSGAEEEE